MTLQKTPLAVMAALVLTALAACGAPPATTPGATPDPGSSALPHGFVAGATEADEPQLRLPYLSADSGTVSILDPLSGQESFTASVPGVESMQHDGRFLFVQTTAGAPLQVIDTGVWTKEHGDHNHYYHAPARQLEGEVKLPAGAVAGDGHRVAIFDAQTGTTTVLSRETLETGEVAVETALPGTPHTGLAVPYEGRMLITGTPGDDKLPTTVAAVDLTDGAASAATILPTTCPSLQGRASTRYGVVFGCSDGVLVIRDDGGSLTSAKIPYPAAESAGAGESAGRATEFSHRPGSSELTSIAGTAGLWHLDVAAAKLQFIPSPEPLVVSTTAGNGSPALAVGGSGTLYAFNILTHEAEARSGLLPGMGQGPPPSLLVDNSRAYLSHPSSKTVHEIDYRDKLRAARTFTTAEAPSQLVETGL